MTVPNRETVVRWEDPQVGLAQLPTMSGIDYLRSMISGLVSGPPISSHFNMNLTEIGEGTATFVCHPQESHYNPIGMVHGGLACSLLDATLGCAAQSLLPAGIGYASIDLTTNYLRPIHVSSGPLTCVGKVIKPGKRVTFAEGEITDSAGQVMATASGSLLMFPLSQE